MVQGEQEAESHGAPTPCMSLRAALSQRPVLQRQEAGRSRLTRPTWETSLNLRLGVVGFPARPSQLAPPA